MILEIVMGVLIGCSLALINAWILRRGTGLALSSSDRRKAVMIVAGSYAARYLLIAIVIYVLLKNGSLTMAVTTLGILGLMTIFWALMQRRACPRS